MYEKAELLLSLCPQYFSRNRTKELETAKLTFAMFG